MQIAFLDVVDVNPQATAAGAPPNRVLQVVHCLVQHVRHKNKCVAAHRRMVWSLLTWRLCSPRLKLRLFFQGSGEAFFRNLAELLAGCEKLTHLYPAIPKASLLSAVQATRAASARVLGAGGAGAGAGAGGASGGGAGAGAMPSTDTRPRAASSGANPTAHAPSDVSRQSSGGSDLVRTAMLSSRVWLCMRATLSLTPVRVCSQSCNPHDISMQSNDSVVNPEEHA